ncbi:formate dehydrogenase accessory sulfurtransferase FdhD [Pontibacter sp. JAM-7]|uniref:formate dehydrogenase accessory sulfurtransferase FdhD n=1 Tax=Pontibacter sp. JAM-7 TaxID=3366581 RepID=UPI003AF7063A
MSITTPSTVPMKTAAGSRQQRYRLGSSDEVAVATLAEEVALALTINQVAHAVMMVSPLSLELFALGFLFNEGVIADPDEIRDMALQSPETQDQRVADKALSPLILDITLSSRASHRYRHDGVIRRRMAGCGVCGTEQLHQAFPELQSNSPQPLPDLSAMGDLHHKFSILQQQRGDFGGLHAAVLLNTSGQVITFQEDIGRHNAMDKAIGYALAQQLDLSQHSIVMSSRCSVELVYKAVRAGLRCLTHLSSPSYQAIAVAKAHNLNLTQQLRNGEHRIFHQNAQALQLSESNHEA